MLGLSVPGKINERIPHVSSEKLSVDDDSVYTHTIIIDFHSFIYYQIYYCNNWAKLEYALQEFVSDKISMRRELKLTLHGVYNVLQKSVSLLEFLPLFESPIRMS